MKTGELETRLPSGVQLLHVCLAKNEVRIALARHGNESIAYADMHGNIETFTMPFLDEEQVPLEINNYNIDEKHLSLSVNGLTYCPEHIRYQLL